MATGRALVAGAVVGAGGIYFLSLGIGLWAAYDRWLALPRFGLLSGGMLFLPLFLAFAGTKAEARAMHLATGSSLLAGAIGLFFLLTHDWQSASTTDFQPLAAVTTWVQQQQPTGRVTTWLLLLRLHENAVAGALMVLFPLGGASCWAQWQRGCVGLTLIGAIALLVAAFALLLTFSRSAWIGLAVATVVTSLAVMMPQRCCWAPFLCGVLLLSLAVITFVINPEILSAAARWFGWHQVGGTAGSRLTLWQNAATLTPDYWFTGSGLQSTAMVLASYVYLLHVPYLAHAHNLYLQMALEQGAPALLAFVIGVCGLLWLSRQEVANNRLIFGATVGLLALLVYGWLDAELYSSALAPLLFLPLALLAALSLRALQPQKGGLVLVGALLPAVAILLLAGLIGLPTLLMVNWAAIQQTRVELSLYQWPTVPLQDDVRQALPKDFAIITAHYRTALQQAPENVAAHRRLGQILLSQNDVSGAARHLESAHRLAPNQRAIRQLLGEVYALQNRAEAARQIWRGLDLSQGQLTLRIQWYAKAGQVRECLLLTKAVQTMTTTVETTTVEY